MSKTRILKNDSFAYYAHKCISHYSSHNHEIVFFNSGRFDSYNWWGSVRLSLEEEMRLENYTRHLS